MTTTDALINEALALGEEFYLEDLTAEDLMAIIRLFRRIQARNLRRLTNGRPPARLLAPVGTR